MPSLQSENESFLDDLEFSEQDCTDILDELNTQYEYEHKDLY